MTKLGRRTMFRRSASDGGMPARKHARGSPRVLAGGALSGSAERHPIASPPPEPIGSAMSYDADLVRASRLMPLVKAGFAASLTEAATRGDLASGDGHHPGRYGDAATVRGCARRGLKGSAAARRA